MKQNEVFNKNFLSKVDALDCIVDRTEHTVVTEHKKKMEFSQCCLLVPGVSDSCGSEAGDEKKSSIFLNNWKNPIRFSVKQIKLVVTVK